jgi:hypothetical protein
VSHLFPNGVITTHSTLLIKLDDFYECLWDPFPFKPDDTGFLKELLPILWHFSEFTGGRIEAVIYEANGVVRDRDLWFFPRAKDYQRH